MAEDREILRELWDGKVPMCFSLAEDETFSTEAPDPYYLMVPRLGYFPLAFEKLQRHFVPFLDPEAKAEIWLEYDGQPLKWHYPVGVLFDLHVTGAEALPWRVVVHFQNFPREEMIGYMGRDSIESHFMSTVKEADSLKHRGQVINNMVKRDHKQLWIGLVNDKFDQFWAINRRLMEQAAGGGAVPSEEAKFVFVPFRLYRPRAPVYAQRLFRPAPDTTLGDLLAAAGDDSPASGRYLIHGIEVPLETPAQWLSEHFSHPDNFLHICRLPEEPAS